MFFVPGVVKGAPPVRRVIVNRLIPGGGDLFFPGDYDRQDAALCYGAAICFEGLNEAGSPEAGAKGFRYLKDGIPATAAFL